MNATATTKIYTLSLHDALPIFPPGAQIALEPRRRAVCQRPRGQQAAHQAVPQTLECDLARSQALVGLAFRGGPLDRKSTRLNSSHTVFSYAVFCLKKKNQTCPQ